MSIKSAADETSSSKTLLPMAKRLYWNANGETNLLQWIDDLNQAAKAEFGIYAQCIQTGAIPHEWTAKFPRPYDYDEMDDFDREMLKLRMIDYNKVQSGFRFEQPKIASFILNNCTESSIKRCKNEYKTDFEKAINDNDIVGILDSLKKAHTFRGKAASMTEIQDAISEATNFRWTSPETLPEFKLRWDNLIDKKFRNLGIPLEKFDEKQRLCAFLRALGAYGHSNAIRQECVRCLSQIDSEATPSLGDIYESFTLLESAERTLSHDTKVVNSAASTISGQLKREGKGSKSGRKNKNGKKSVKKNGNKEKSDKNPKTRAYAEKKSKETGQSLKEIYKSIKCNKCGKNGHISPDCLADKEKDEDQAHTRPDNAKGKQKGKPLGSLFNASAQSQEEEEEACEHPFGCWSSSSEINGDVFAHNRYFNNRLCMSLDGHANICVFNNKTQLKNIRRLSEPYTIEGLHGTKFSYQFVGDHDILGEVIYDEANKYNIVSQSVLRKQGYLVRISEDNDYIDVVQSGATKPVMRFYLDHRDGFYKCPFNSVSAVKSVYNNILIKPEKERSEKLKMFTNEQIERAERAIALHSALGHPGDEALSSLLNSPSLINCEVTASDLRNARELQGPCPICLQAKPLPVTGSYPTYGRDNERQPGEHIRGDIIFVLKVPYLFAMDARSRHYTVVRLVNQSATALKTGLEIVFNWYKSNLRVTRYFTSDHENVFGALEQWLNSQSIAYNSTVPGEHEKSLERGVRDVRQSFRAVLLELPYRLAPMFAPYLVFHVVDCRNMVPNSMSAPLSPVEMVTGQKINYRTDILTVFGQLVLTQVKNNTGNATVMVNEIGLALGRCTNTKGSVWVYLKGHTKPLSRRPLKIMPMTQDWLDHLNSLADTKPSDPATYLEFRPGLAVGPDEYEEQLVSETKGTISMPGPDSDPREDTVHVQQQPPLVTPRTSASSIEEGPSVPVMSPEQQSPERSRQLEPLPPGTSATTPRRAPSGPSEQPREVPPIAVAPSSPVQMKPKTPTVGEVRPPPPASEVPERRQRSARARPSSADVSIDNIIEGSRTRKPAMKYAKDYVINMVKALHNLDETKPPEGVLDQACVPELLSFMGDHDPEPLDTWTVMQIRLESALKTKHCKDAESAAVKELTNIIKYKTWKYLKCLEEREPSVHTKVLPCQMFIKDKRDANGNLISWKGRLANGGNHTDPEAYSPFDKTSPTANIDAVYAFLALAQHKKMGVETNDVPSAYLHANLRSGQKHVMRISSTLAKYTCIADPTAKKYLQEDGTLLVELQRALYGLPEAGKLWHEHLSTLLRRIGYEQKEGDTCQWKYEQRSQVTGKLISVSYLLIYVDDILHIYAGEQNGKVVRDRLHIALVKAGLPQLTSHRLTVDNSISFLGLCIQILPGYRISVSQPGYIEAIVANFPSGTDGMPAKTRESPLPANFSTRTLTPEDEQPLNGEFTKLYLKWVQSLAWTTRSRPDLSCAVAHKQTRCSNPRVIDWNDLKHIVGYLNKTAKHGIIIDVDSLKLTSYIDCGWATHENRNSHSGCLNVLGEKRLVPVSWKSCKQKIVTSSSTEGELVTLSDMADSVLVMCAQLEFLGVRVQKPIPIMQDNTSTITISYLGRPSLHSRRRFIDIRYFWFKQFIDSGLFALKYCKSEEQLADLLASVRSGSRFKTLRRKIMGNP